MAERTVFLSKLIGVYCIVVAVAMAFNRAATLQAVTALVADPALLYVFGLTVTAAGLALVLAHNRWRALPQIVISIVGWGALIKGLLFLLLPPSAAGGMALWLVPYERFYYGDVIVALVIGCYLAYYGFTARRETS